MSNIKNTSECHIPRRNAWHGARGDARRSNFDCRSKYKHTKREMV